MTNPNPDSGELTARLSNRRDPLRLGGAVGLAVAAGAVARGSVSAQDATPQTGGLSITKQTISLGAAATLIEAAQAKAEEIGGRFAIAVVDEGGLLKAFHRMDGVNSAATVDFVQMKAYAAASFRTPTHQLAEGVMDNPPRAASLANIPRFTLAAGGYPVLDGEVVIGGIGIGGGSPDQDMEVAEAALAALMG